MPKVSRLEVIQTGARRRWTLEEKRRIVAESDSGARQVSATARRYGLSTGQLFTWRRLARQQALSPVTMFVPAVVDRVEPEPTVLIKAPRRVRRRADVDGIDDGQ